MGSFVVYEQGRMWKESIMTIYLDGQVKLQNAAFRIPRGCRDWNIGPAK